MGVSSGQSDPSDTMQKVLDCMLKETRSMCEGQNFRQGRQLCRITYAGMMQESGSMKNQYL